VERRGQIKKGGSEIAYRRVAAQQRLDAARLKEETTLLGQTKKIAEIVMHVIPSQPSENAELPAFFDSVKNLFKLYEISDDLKSKILLP